VKALDQFENQWLAIIESLEKGTFKRLENQLKTTARSLRNIPLKMPVRDVPTISLTGEIFVRRDGLSRQYLTEKLAQKGFATTCTPVAEWVFYSEYLVDHGLIDQPMPFMDRIRFKIRKKVMAADEQRLRSFLAESGLVNSPPIDIPHIIENARPYISRELTGEAVLTIGGSLSDIATHACGVIAIGPFGCMPNRLSEAIMHETMRREKKLASKPADNHLKEALSRVDDLPFLAVESDGSPFPQVIEAKLEAFCLRARRMHAHMRQAGAADLKTT
jgi:predicted nucleotide-binding protein (sugar kinase/HSP70/actin superfamily)